MQATELPLKDIHIPADISWFPPAIGWWILALLIPLLIVLSIWIYKRLTRKTALKTAHKLLAELQQNKLQDKLIMICELSALLRRVAISIATREKVAGLIGRQWLEFLDSTVKGEPFTKGVGQLLADAPYRKMPVTDPELSQLIALCEDWLKAQKKS